MNLKSPLKRPLWLWWLVVIAALVSLKGKPCLHKCNANVFGCNDTKINMMIIVFISDEPRAIFLYEAAMAVIASIKILFACIVFCPLFMLFQGQTLRKNVCPTQCVPFRSFETCEKRGQTESRIQHCVIS